MESLILLGILVLLAPAVLAIIALASNRNLNRRVEALEARLAAGDGPAIPSMADAPQRVSEPPPPADAPSAAPEDGPWNPPEKDPGPETATAGGTATGGQPPASTQAVVFNTDRLARLTAWLAANWFYAVSAISLGLAGIFLVQYGMESGFLPPRARVLAALAFGAALIGAGEFLRRRSGDDEATSTAYLPSVFAGAGIVTLFAGILSARLLYALIGPETAFAALVAIALLGVVIGWFYGPLLAAIGVAGAMAAPFIVGGSSDNPTWLFAYIPVIAALGLAIDAMRRWAWVSVLSLILAAVAGGLVLSTTGAAPEFVAMATALVVATIFLPLMKRRPDHDGPLTVSAFMGGRDAPWPEFPTRLVAGIMVFWAAATLYLVATHGQAFWPVLIAALILVVLFALWLDRATALTDIALVPFGVLIGAVMLEALGRGDTYLGLSNPPEGFPEDVVISALTGVVAAALAASALAAFRSLRETSYPLVWTFAATATAPLMATGLYLFWNFERVLSPAAFSLHVAAIALLMGGLAERYARRDDAVRLRAAMAVLAALAMLALAAFGVLTKAPLTAALALTLVAAAFLDRRFALPQLTLFLVAGTAVLTYRLLIDPGLDWAVRADVGAMTLAHIGPIAAYAAAWWLLRPLDRPRARAALESGLIVCTGIFASVLLERWMRGDGTADTTFWSVGLHATIWLLAAFAQFRRARRLRSFAFVAGCAFTAVAALLIAGAVVFLNPLDSFTPVLGPPIVNSLIPGYLLPAAIAFAMARLLPVLPRLMRLGLFLTATALAAWWAFLAIRHFWRGEEMSTPGFTQPELYTYTVALLLVGAALIYRSIATGSDNLRRGGVAVIGLAVAKVFLVDISGLTGLTRVFSFLALGLALAGLAWLNRWASAQGEETETAAEPD